MYVRVGGLDERFFAHMEEIDLCWRVHLAGYDIVVLPTSHVFHLGGGSLPASNPRKTYLNFRNNLLLLHKNLPNSTRRGKLFRRRLLDTIAWCKFVAGFDFKNAGAILRAHRDFKNMRREYTVHPETDLLDARTDTHVNILVQYYLNIVFRNLSFKKYFMRFFRNNHTLRYRTISGGNVGQYKKILKKG